MSALSNCVTCGIAFHAWLRCSAVLRRMPRHRLALDLAPLGEIRQRRARRMPARAAPLAAAAWPLPPRLFITRLANSLTSSCVMRPPGPVPGTWRDVDADLARQPAHRRRGGRGGDVRRRAGGGGGGAGAAAADAPAAMFVTDALGRSGACRCLQVPQVPAGACGACRCGCGLPCAGAAASGFGAFAARRLQPCAPWHRCARSAGTVFKRQHRLARLDLVAGLDLDLGDLAGDVRRHFDRRLVGFELERPADRPPPCRRP